MTRNVLIQLCAKFQLASSNLRRSDQCWDGALNAFMINQPVWHAIFTDHPFLPGHNTFLWVEPKDVCRLLKARNIILHDMCLCGTCKNETSISIDYHLIKDEEDVELLTFQVLCEEYFQRNMK